MPAPNVARFTARGGKLLLYSGDGTGRCGDRLLDEGAMIRALEEWMERGRPR
jgi:hypothetical protein